MSKNKRKYTKGPAWFKAHSPKAQAARKIKLVREIKYGSTNKFKKGDKVIFPSAMYSPLEVTRVWYDRRGYWLYELDGDARRKYRENELEYHSVDRIRAALDYNSVRVSELKNKASALESEVNRWREVANKTSDKCNTLRDELTTWHIAFPNMTPKQAMDKLEYAERDRVGMMNASNGCIAEANKLRQVNAKLVEVISLLTR